MAKPYDIIAFGITIDREHWKNVRFRSLRAVIDKKKYKTNYPVLVNRFGSFIDWLHLDAYKFFHHLAAIPKGMEVHHRKGNIRDVRFERLVLKTPEGHRAVHRLEELKEREESPALGSLWYPHSPKAPVDVSQAVRARLIADRVEEMRNKLPGLPTRKQEELSLKMALEENFESLEARAWPLSSKTRIPPHSKTKSMLDKDVLKDDVRPFTRACSFAEAGYVYLLRLHRRSKHEFHHESALMELNALRSKGLPEIPQVVFDKFRLSPRVNEAMKILMKYERLPVARFAWDRMKVKIRKARQKEEMEEMALERPHSAMLEAEQAPVMPAPLPHFGPWRRTTSSRPTPAWWSPSSSDNQTVHDRLGWDI